jgi:hypothetical protein
MAKHPVYVHGKGVAKHTKMLHHPDRKGGEDHKTTTHGTHASKARGGAHNHPAYNGDNQAPTMAPPGPMPAGMGPPSAGPADNDAPGAAI